MVAGSCYSSRDAKIKVSLNLVFCLFVLMGVGMGQKKIFFHSWGSKKRKIIHKNQPDHSIISPHVVLPLMEMRYRDARLQKQGYPFGPQE